MSLPDTPEGLWRLAKVGFGYDLTPDDKAMLLAAADLLEALTRDRDICRAQANDAYGKWCAEHDRAEALAAELAATKAKLAEVEAAEKQRDAELQDQHRVRKAWAARALAAESASRARMVSAAAFAAHTRAMQEARNAALDEAAKMADHEHGREFIGKGRNPADYTGRFSLFAAAIRNLKEPKA
jgi:hypothetical protein